MNRCPKCGYNPLTKIDYVFAYMVIFGILFGVGTELVLCIFTIEVPGLSISMGLSGGAFGAVYAWLTDREKRKNRKAKDGDKTEVQ